MQHIKGTNLGAPCQERPSANKWSSGKIGLPRKKWHIKRKCLPSTHCCCAVPKKWQYTLISWQFMKWTTNFHLRIGPCRHKYKKILIIYRKDAVTYSAKIQLCCLQTHYTCSPKHMMPTNWLHNLYKQTTVSQRKVSHSIRISFPLKYPKPHMQTLKCTSVVHHQNSKLSNIHNVESANRHGGAVQWCSPFLAVTQTNTLSSP